MIDEYKIVDNNKGYYNNILIKDKSNNESLDNYINKSDNKNKEVSWEDDYIDLLFDKLKNNFIKSEDNNFLYSENKDNYCKNACQR